MKTIYEICTRQLDGQNRGYDSGVRRFYEDKADAQKYCDEKNAPLVAEYERHNREMESYAEKQMAEWDAQLPGTQRGPRPIQTWTRSRFPYSYTEDWHAVRAVDVIEAGEDHEQTN